jgi:hypothetical protein
MSSELVEIFPATLMVYITLSLMKDQMFFVLINTVLRKDEYPVSKTDFVTQDDWNAKGKKDCSNGINFIFPKN